MEYCLFVAQFNVIFDFDFGSKSGSFSFLFHVEAEAAEQNFQNSKGEAEAIEKEFSISKLTLNRVATVFHFCNR